MASLDPGDGVVELHDVRQHEARFGGCRRDVVLADELERRRAANARQVRQTGEPEVAHERRRVAGEAVRERIELPRDAAPGLVQQALAEDRVADHDHLAQLVPTGLIADL